MKGLRKKSRDNLETARKLAIDDIKHALSSPYGDAYTEVMEKRNDLWKAEAARQQQNITASPGRMIPRPVPVSTFIPSTTTGSSTINWDNINALTERMMAQSPRFQEAIQNGLRREENAVANETTAVATMERPTAEVLEKKDTSHLVAEYESLSDELGFTSGVNLISTEKLRMYLAEAEIPVFDHKKVWTYLSSLCEEKNKGPMGALSYTRYANTRWLLGEYELAIPLEILRTAAQVKRECGVGVSFSVLGIKSYEVYPDPFLCVTADGHTQFVIGVWDEPGFSLDPRKNKEENKEEK